MIEFIFIGFLTFCIGYIAGVIKGTHDLIQMLLKYPQEFDKIKQKLANEIKIEKPKVQQETMTIERHGDELYAFTQSGDFLAQAPTMNLLIQRLTERYPDRNFKEHLAPKTQKI
jgi:hypothetical protein